MMLLHLAEIACGNFSGHYFVARRQKTRFLPTTHCLRLRRPGNFSGHYFVARRQKTRFLPATHCLRLRRPSDSCEHDFAAGPAAHCDIHYRRQCGG
jgi:hypothetical protein